MIPCRGLSLSRYLYEALIPDIGDAELQHDRRCPNKSDEDAVRALPHAFCEAWAKHDGHQLATIMAEDVDFVTVGGAWFHGCASGSEKKFPGFIWRRLSA